MAITKFAVLEKTEPGLRFYAFASEEAGYTCTSFRKLPFWPAQQQPSHVETI